MKRIHVEWAKRHDWYICAEQMLSGEWIVACVNSTNGSTLCFTDYQKLREWVGH